MGKEKAGFLTPKAIANRIKAKGLQKLKFYCQMCQKQCRDENGFKCHTMSESHLRQMEIFSADSTRFMNEFSKEFEDGMMEIIRRKARHNRQNANDLYRDYISDKQHFHMNATVWTTLTDFVMYLGRTGKCEVDETEKGWFVTYVDRDPETLARMEQRAKRERSELDSDERHQREIEHQVKAARLAAEQQRGDGDGDGAEASAPTELMRTDEKIVLGGLAPRPAGGSSAGGGGGFAAGKPRLVAPLRAAQLGGDDDDHGGDNVGGAAAAAGAPQGGHGGPGGSGGKKMSALESLMLEQKARKERADAAAAAAAAAANPGAAAGAGGGGGGAAAAPPADAWLARGIVVKVVNKRLADGKYYKKKGVVEAVVEHTTAHVRIHESGDLLRLGQADLETVIPSVGGRVLMLRGPCKGEPAALLAIDEARFCVRVQLEGGGRVLDAVEYDDVSKLPSR